MYHALLKCTRTSLTVLKKRASSHAKDFSQVAFFEVDISLQVPDIVLNPNLDQVQVSTALVVIYRINPGAGGNLPGRPGDHQLLAADS
jgi:hypothetical protein